MRTPPTLKALVASFSLAILAGCASSGGGDQDGALYGADGTHGADSRGYDQRSGVTVNTLDGARVSGTGFDATRQQRDRQHLDPNIPEHRTIYFGFDNYSIRSEFAEILYDHASYLKANAHARVALQGHTDDRGTREYNMALGERRANSVKRFLMMLDVKEEQMEVVSYGEERPAARGNDEQTYAKNRRVELRY